MVATLPEHCLIYAEPGHVGSLIVTNKVNMFVIPEKFHVRLFHASGRNVSLGYLQYLKLFLFQIK